MAGGSWRAGQGYWVAHAAASLPCGCAPRSRPENTSTPGLRMCNPKSMRTRQAGGGAVCDVLAKGSGAHAAGAGGASLVASGDLLQQSTPTGQPTVCQCMD